MLRFRDISRLFYWFSVKTRKRSCVYFLFHPFSEQFSEKLDLFFHARLIYNDIVNLIHIKS